MKYAISRSINGISLNGQEFLLTPEGDVMTFTSQALAHSFAAKLCTGQHGVPVQLEDYGINICRIDDDGHYALL